MKSIGFETIAIFVIIVGVSYALNRSVVPKLDRFAVGYRMALSLLGIVVCLVGGLAALAFATRAAAPLIVGVMYLGLMFFFSVLTRLLLVRIRSKLLG